MFFGDLNMGNNPGTTGLSFPFGGDGHADLVTVMTEGSTCLRMLQELGGESRYIFFDRGILFSQLFEFPFEGRGRKDVKAHPGVD